MKQEYYTLHGNISHDGIMIRILWMYHIILVMISYSHFHY